MAGRGARPRPVRVASDAAVTSRQPVIADLASVSLSGRSGAVWAHESEQLNANLVKLEAGESIADHLNGEVDVLLVVQGGAGSVVIDGVAHEVADQSVVLVPRGTRRSIHADRRLLYFSIHQRREPLTVGQEKPRTI